VGLRAVEIAYPLLREKSLENVKDKRGWER
jgi:hypothetical protein